MRWLLVAVALVVAGGASGPAAASDSGDLRSARALVVARADVPGFWTATVIRNPCPSVTHRGVPLSARAASRWGGTVAGVWSVAHVTPLVSQGRQLYTQIAAALPACVARFWQSHWLPPAAETPEVRVAQRPAPHLGDEQRLWRVTVTPREAAPRPVAFDVLVVRKGRSVAQYVYNGGDGAAAVRRAVGRG